MSAGGGRHFLLSWLLFASCIEWEYSHYIKELLKDDETWGHTSTVFLSLMFRNTAIEKSWHTSATFCLVKMLYSSGYQLSSWLKSSWKEWEWTKEELQELLRQLYAALTSSLRAGRGFGWVLEKGGVRVLGSASSLALVIDEVVDIRNLRNTLEVPMYWCQVMRHAYWIKKDAAIYLAMSLIGSWRAFMLYYALHTLMYFGTNWTMLMNVSHHGEGKIWNCGSCRAWGPHAVKAANIVVLDVAHLYLSPDALLIMVVWLLQTGWEFCPAPVNRKLDPKVLKQRLQTNFCVDNIHCG